MSRPRQSAGASLGGHERFFEAVADEVTKRAGLRREDLLMAITEVPWENWWTHGRMVDPKTGFDTRMKGQNDGRR